MEDEEFNKYDAQDEQYEEPKLQTVSKNNVGRGVVSEQESRRDRPFTAKQKKFLTALVKNEFKDPGGCLEKAGYSRSSWGTIFALKEDIKEIAEAVLIANAPIAAMSIAGILNAERVAPMAGTKLQAAKEILDRIGLTKEERVKHQVEHQGGIFIIPAKAPMNYNYTDAIDGEICD